MQAGFTSARPEHKMMIVCVRRMYPSAHFTKPPSPYRLPTSGSAGIVVLFVKWKELTSSVLVVRLQDCSCPPSGVGLDTLCGKGSRWPIVGVQASMGVSEQTVWGRGPWLCSAESGE